MTDTVQVPERERLDRQAVLDAINTAEPIHRRWISRLELHAVVSNMATAPRPPVQEPAMSPEWCLAMAEHETGHEVGAGMPDHPLRSPPPVQEPVDGEGRRVSARYADYVAGLMSAQRILNEDGPEWAAVERAIVLLTFGEPTRLARPLPSSDGSVERMREALITARTSFDRDPDDSDYQRGYKHALDWAIEYIAALTALDSAVTDGTTDKDQPNANQ